MTYTTVSSKDFVEMHRKGDVRLCLDVRTPGEFNSGFCFGSHNLPLHDLSFEGVGDLLGSHKLDQHLPVYLMCLAGKRAVMAAEKLAGKIPNPLVVVEGGVNALPADLLKMSRKKVLPLDRQVRIAIGLMVLLGVVIGSMVSPIGYLLSACAGAGLVMAGITDSCLMASFVARLPWNRA